ncbi:MAG: GDSL-type esterase/lipase family protein [Planctomycetia bacterium]|nr:GDSL-type esterase/lipase family protein [Planctomycetia bacterium]
MKTRSFRWMPLALLVVLGSTLAWGQNIAVTPTEKKDDWWQKRHQDKVAQAAKGEAEIVFLGDSITHFWEGAGKDVFQKYYGDRKVLNLGFSADRTEHVLWRLENGEVDNIQPKMVMLMIGTNNVGHNSTTPAETVEGIRAILVKLGEKLPKTKVLLLAVFPRGADGNDGLRQKVNEINAGLPALADNERVFFLDINAGFLKDGDVLPKEIMPDLLHPNAAGYEIWAKAVEPWVWKLAYADTTTPASKMGDNWWKNRHEKKTAQAALGEAQMILLGDSITHGWESNGAEIFAKYYAPRKALNLGYGGDRTQHVLWRLENGEVDNIQPKVAMVMIGTNNMGANSVQEIVEGNKAIVAKLQEKLPQTKILLLGIFPRGDNAQSDLRKKVAEVNARLEKLSDGEKVFYFTFNDKLLAENGDMVPELMPDKVHLTKAGYTIWAESCEEMVQKLEQ